jgi:DNA repair exonuclease SbcCD nuclease subunit
VIFAGDVVESTNARYEAIRPLESAVRKLVDAGIEVVAVVGNHDVDALPRLAELIDGVKILGAGGRWETHVVRSAGQPICELVGWSFPQQKVTSSPVAELLQHPLPPQSGVRRFGLLHCDLDAAAGPYAPVARRELEQTGLDAWFLGHIHKPSPSEAFQAGGSLRGGYLGSLVGLNPKETGDHGPWLVRIEGGKTSIEHVPLAPLRWERADLYLRPEDEPDDLGDRLLELLEQRTREILARDITPPELIGFRFRLLGETRKYDEFCRWVEKQEWSEMVRTVASTIAFVEKVENRIELAVDLEEIAKGDDPPGLLARKLLTLAREGAARVALIEEARVALREVVDDSHYSPLRDERDAEDPLSDAAISEQLKHAGIAALNALLAQRDVASPAEAGGR